MFLHRQTKLPQQVAIDNGIKLMGKCFDKQVVKLDPSSSDSETTIYRPIDKYANVLPHLIGSDDWNRKWHAGILDKHPENERRRQASTSLSQKHEEESSNEKTSNLLSARRESLESVAKSVSSAGGDQMVINSLQPSGIFSDNNEDELNVSKDPIVPSSSSSMFRSQPDQRRLVNLFNDEPPSMDSSPAAVRKPVNLFDDYGSVDSFPSDTSEDRAKSQTVSTSTASTVQPPVDLFNDNEFENFIDKLEKQQGQSGASSQNEKPSKSVTSSVDKNPMAGGDMKKIAEEIKKVQLKKVGGGGDAASVKTTISEKKSETTAAASSAKSSDFKQMLSKTLERQAVGDIKSRPKMEDVKSTPPPPVAVQKAKKPIANLFDDDDDNGVASLKKIDTPKPVDKSAEKPKEAQKKTKLTNLFDDDDDDDPFDKIFKKKSDALPSKPITAVSKKLFGDEVDEKSISTLSKSKSLFDGEKREVKAIPPTKEPTREAIKTFRDEKQTTDEEKHIKKSEKVFESEEEEKIDAEKYSKTIQNTSSSVTKIVEEKPTKIPQSTSEEKLFTTSQEPFKKIADAEKSVKRDENQSSPFKPFSVPFLSDEPPDDDTWITEDNNFDEHDNRVNDCNTPNSFNYSSMPIFDEMPPEDNFSSKPPVPEPNFCSDEEEPVKIEIPKKVEKSKDDSKVENSSNPVSAGIRGKLDHLFKKQQEKEAATVKDSPKKAPGKLSSDLKINVGALMPGMRPPPMKKSAEDKSPNESFEKKDEESEKQTKSISALAASVTDGKSSEDRLNLLNNDLTKSRAKIQVKRRPSTRRARQESYQKTMSSYIAEESKEEEITTRPMSAVFSRETVRKSVELTEEKSVTSSKKILPSSIFGDESDSEDLLANVTTQRREEKGSLSKSSVVTNKIPVFYDDEADTKKMLEEQKKVEEGKQKEDIKSKIFDDESDDDLFAKKSPKPAPPSAQKSSTKSKSLFDDEDDDGNMFASKSTKQSSETLTVTAIATLSPKKLFESDDDDLLKKPIASSSKPKTEKSISKSLFGDDDDDDDLFSSKPKSKFRLN